jgi:hypothetical protein
VQIKGVRPRELKHRNGEFFRIAGREWLTLACHLHLEEQPAAQVAECIRAGLADLSLSYELGEGAEPEEIQLHFGAALAVGDRSTARFLSTMHREQWGFPPPLEGEIPAWITRAVFSIHLGEIAEAGIGMDLLQGLIFESELSEGASARKAEFESTYRILEALQKKDAAAFRAQLSGREAARALLLQEEPGHEPLALIDFAGLAFCRMAVDAGMKVDVADPYLPLELFRVPPPAPPPPA